MMDQAKARITKASPLAAMFVRNPDDIPATTLLRHAIEQAQSAKLFHPLEAKAFCLLEDADSPVARLWGVHGMSEANRESAALRYLRDAGLGSSAITEIPMLTSTLRLRRFVEWATGSHGPMPILLHALWMERNPDLGAGIFLSNPAVADQARVEGMLDVIEDGIRSDADLNAAGQLIDAIAEFSGMYFSELDAVCGNAGLADRERRLSTPIGLPAR
jgi:hypothetical protein